MAELAAKQGLLEAQTRLAALYGSGPLAMRRPDLALQWYEAAAEQGDLKSQVNAGIIHNSGPRGVERNPQAAAKWFRIAAELGSSAAQYSLATLLENRTAPSKDNIEAYAWYRVAMAQGHSRARSRVTSLENRLSPRIWWWPRPWLNSSGSHSPPHSETQAKRRRFTHLEPGHSRHNKKLAQRNRWLVIAKNLHS